MNNQYQNKKESEGLVDDYYQDDFEWTKQPLFSSIITFY